MEISSANKDEPATMTDTPDSHTHADNGIQALSLLVETNQKIHQRTLDFTQMLAMHLHYYLPGTRTSHLKDVSDWINSTEYQAHKKGDIKYYQNKSGNTIYWVAGDAGTGKSIMSAKLIEIHYNQSLVGWHFCDHSNPLQNSSIAIMESVSGIMASKLPEYKTAILDLDQKKLEEAKTKGDSMEFFSLLFIKPMNSMAPPKDKEGNICRKLIVIDAIDEMDHEDLVDFLRTIRDGASELPPWVGLFMTSRRYDIILKYLSEKASTTIVVDLLFEHGTRICLLVCRIVLIFYLEHE